jgi:hypothetical protein
MLALPNFRFLSDPSPRTQSVCWVLTLIGILGLIAGGVRLAVYGWSEAALPDAEQLLRAGAPDSGTSLHQARSSVLALAVAGTVIACLGVGFFHTWARNANCGWLSRLVRRFVAGYVRLAALLGLGLCALGCIESLVLMVKDEWWLDAADEPFSTLFLIVILVFGSGAIAVLGYLYWYRPKWRKR